MFWRAVIGGQSTRRLATLDHGGFRMKCDLNEMLQRQFYFFGTYFVEKSILHCWQSAASNAAVTFDVGANVGIYSLAALASRPDAMVHAFEPTPEIAAHLRETAAINRLDRLCVQEVAVSNINGYAHLRRCRGDLGENGGMNFISEYSTREVSYEARRGRVKTLRLDTFCRDNSVEQIDLLKIDIQGHEHLALLGAADLISAGCIGTIFLELNWAAEAGQACPATQSICQLEQAGYKFAEPAGRLMWKQAGDWMRSLSDVVARRAT